ncbi:MAG: tyrosine-type recombinase/integrase [Bacteroidota bacterium]|nr:tyrosine-type recombinase/integrase [Bacteroidota bacterium]
MNEAEFLKYIKSQKGYSEHTVISYGGDLKSFRIFGEENHLFDSIDRATAKDIRIWISSLKRGDMSSRSVNRKIASLKSFYKYLLRSGDIAVNPAVNISNLKSDKKLPEFIKAEALDILFDSNHFSDDFEGVRDRLIIEMLYGTGLRRAELMSLKPESIDIQQCKLKVLGKNNKERIVPFPEPLQDRIRHYTEFRKEMFPENNDFFITKKGKSIYPKLIWRVVNKYLSYTTGIKQRSPHILRHTYATHLLNSGADINAVKELLGHANLSATQIYTHNTFEHLNSIYKQAHPRA